ncbi:MAG: hypothetical protein SWO11_20800 [Thermodesulfobacteriota bacterium]|nr:hypothetical protein [Thermodesulfobacteriota bacterium]
MSHIAVRKSLFNENTRRFRNFLRYDRKWLEEEGSQDSHGRSIWGLGKAVVLSHSDNIRGAALDIFEKSVPTLLDLQSPRAWAFGLLGIHAYLRKYSGDSEVRRIRERLSDRLFKLYQENASDDWPWIEDTLTYANGKISHALILSGNWLSRRDMLNAGLRSLKWLVGIQTDPKGHFVPIGNNGWYSRGGEKARFDQQPVEALAVIEACFEAYNITKETTWISFAQRSFDWFLGQNDMNVPLYDPTSGGCCDGLGADGPNRNQGAESTLAWLLSLFHLYRLTNTQVFIEASKKIEFESQRKEVTNVS